MSRSAIGSLLLTVTVRYIRRAGRRGVRHLSPPRPTPRPALSQFFSSLEPRSPPTASAAVRVLTGDSDPVRGLHPSRRSFCAHTGCGKSNSTLKYAQVACANSLLTLERLASTLVQFQTRTCSATMNRLSTSERARILHALCEGTSINATSRLTGASKVTILKLLAEAG